ncbi:hypothetical protein HDU80_003792, partial [Chytriomyces hyalinus]
MSTDSDKMKTDRVILNDSNYTTWRRLTLSEIGSEYMRTLSENFIQYINPYVRPEYPDSWHHQLQTHAQIADRAANETEDSELNDGNSLNEELEANSETGNEFEEVEDFPNAAKIAFRKLKMLDVVWQRAESKSLADAQAVKYTMRAIRGGMSKAMQQQYSTHDTPYKLWTELQRLQDPANQRLDTSAADTYRSLVIRKNQKIPDWLKLVRETEDACMAAGETLHEGLAAQKKVRLCLDYRFAQAVMSLSSIEHLTLADLEKAMIDLWDGYTNALSRNVEDEPKPKANVTIGNPDRKRKMDSKSKSPT